MNFQEYSLLALRTAKPLSKAQQILHAQIGMASEGGELADAIKKHVIYGKALDKVNVMEEIADIFWYLNLYIVESDVNPSAVTNAVKQIAESPGELQKMYDANPFELVEVLLAMTALTATLTIPEKNRGASNDTVVFHISLMLCGLLEFCGYTLSQALETNINKLAARYGDKYSDYNALNRDTDSERVILENANVKFD